MAFYSGEMKGEQGSITQDTSVCSKKTSVSDRQMPGTPLHSAVVSVYVVFGAISAYTIKYLSDCDWSALIAADYALQALATVQLLVHVQITGKMKGISVGMLQALAMSYGFRLSSTLWLQGYLPSDRTGSWFCQAMDITSLMCVLRLLQRVYGSERDAQELEADQLPMGLLLSACVIIGSVCHTNLDLRPIFDTLWTAGFLAGCIAPLPQLAVTLLCEGVQPLTSHFTAPLSLGVGATAAFWRYGVLELEPARIAWCVTGGVVLQVTLTLCLLVASTAWGRAAAVTAGVVGGSHIELGIKAPLFDI